MQQPIPTYHLAAPQPAQSENGAARDGGSLDLKIGKNDSEEDETDWEFAGALR
jgi:hypothetical protein